MHAKKKLSTQLTTLETLLFNGFAAINFAKLCMKMLKTITEVSILNDKIILQNKFCHHFEVFKFFWIVISSVYCLLRCFWIVAEKKIPTNKKKFKKQPVKLTDLYFSYFNIYKQGSYASGDKYYNFRKVLFAIFNEKKFLCLDMEAITSWEFGFSNALNPQNFLRHTNSEK